MPRVRRVKSWSKSENKYAKSASALYLHARSFVRGAQLQDYCRPRLLKRRQLARAMYNTSWSTPFPSCPHQRLFHPTQALSQLASALYPLPHPSGPNQSARSSQPRPASPPPCSPS
jgi:hypothetical protein